jgi:Protein of unknown function (DUF4238)
VSVPDYMSSLNIPRDHHYVPRSFFKPWADEKQWLVVYERKKGVVLRPYKRSTKSICMLRDLYSYTDDVDVTQRNAIEQKLLSKVDDNGARVLQKLYLQEGSIRLTDQDRYYFAVFINSLRIRTPEAFAHYAIKAEEILRNKLTANDSGQEEKNIEGELDELSLVEWVEKSQPTLFKNFGHQLLAKFIIDKKFVNRIMNMHWIIIRRYSDETHLLTSDRPLVLIGSVDSQNLGFALAISPEKIFLATGDPNSISQLLKFTPKRLIHQMNISTIQQAKNKVFSVDKSHSINFFVSRLGIQHRILPWTSS